jgi:hypothetical protein
MDGDDRRLSRRHEWTLAYAAFGYTTLHGMQMAWEAFEWPLAVTRVTLLIALLGVPVAATLACLAIQTVRTTAIWRRFGNVGSTSLCSTAGKLSRGAAEAYNPRRRLSIRTT